MFISLIPKIWQVLPPGRVHIYITGTLKVNILNENLKIPKLIHFRPQNWSILFLTCFYSFLVFLNQRRHSTQAPASKKYETNVFCPFYCRLTVKSKKESTVFVKPFLPVPWDREGSNHEIKQTKKISWLCLLELPVHIQGAATTVKISSVTTTFLLQTIQHNIVWFIWETVIHPDLDCSDCVLDRKTWRKYTVHSLELLHDGSGKRCPWGGD